MISEVDRAHKARKKGVPFDKICRHCGNVRIDGTTCCEGHEKELMDKRDPEIFYKLDNEELEEILENAADHSRRASAAREELTHRWELDQKYD